MIINFLSINGIADTVLCQSSNSFSVFSIWDSVHYREVLVLLWSGISLTSGRITAQRFHCYLNSYSPRQERKSK